MAEAATAAAALPVERPRRRNIRLEAAWLAFKRDKTAIVSLSLLLIIIVACVVAPLLPIDPNATDLANRLAAPSWQHIFGTDEYGRDYLARVLYGGRVSLLVGVLAMLTSLVIGILVGTIAGLFGGIVDAILMRLVDILSSIPWLVLVTVLALFMGQGITSIILVIGLFSWMEISRIVRAEFSRSRSATSSSTPAAASRRCR